MSTDRPRMDEAEFYNRAKSMLIDMGVSNPQIGESGTIPIEQEGEFEIIDIKARRKTSKSVNDMVSLREMQRGVSDSNEYDRLLCNILKCRALEFLGIECKKESETFIDPIINVSSTPTAVSQATVELLPDPTRPWDARIIGDVRVEASNESEPGEIITEVSSKCDDDVERDRSPVLDSAFIDTVTDHDIFLQDFNEFLDRVESSFQDVRPDANVSTDATFEKTGALSTIEGIADIWLTGSTTGLVETTMTVEYEWMDREFTEEFESEIEIRLPIEELNYTL